MRTLNTLKAVPPAPAGWQLQTPKFENTEAPTSTCKALKLTAEHAVTHVSIEQQQLKQQCRRESDARIAALRKLSPDEQKQFDDFSRQGVQLSAQSAAARKDNNPTEADRLREEAKQFFAKSKAIQQAHMDKIAPQIRAIADDRSKYGNPEVRVHLAVDNLPAGADSGAGQVQIPNVSQAFFDCHKALVMSFGREVSNPY